MMISGKNFAANLDGKIELCASEVGRFIVIVTDHGAISINNERLSVQTPHRVKSFTNQRGEVVTIQRTA